MSERDEAIKAAVISHLEEIKQTSLDMGVFSEDEIEKIPLEKLIEFALSYQILHLDRLLTSGEEVKKNTLSTLRVYADMMKIIVGIKSSVKEDSKISINDPLEQLKKKLHIEAIE